MLDSIQAVTQVMKDTADFVFTVFSTIALVITLRKADKKK